VRSRELSMTGVLEALRDGRSYVAFEGLAPVPFLRFYAQDGRVHVEVPKPSEVHLVCDGRPAGSAEGERVSLEIPPAIGHCRVEVFLRGRLWIASAYARIS